MLHGVIFFVRPQIRSTQGPSQQTLFLTSFLVSQEGISSTTKQIRFARRSERIASRKRYAEIATCMECSSQSNAISGRKTPRTLLLATKSSRGARMAQSVIVRGLGARDPEFDSRISHPCFDFFPFCVA